MKNFFEEYQILKTLMRCKVFLIHLKEIKPHNPQLIKVTFKNIPPFLNILWTGTKFKINGRKLGRKQS